MQGERWGLAPVREPGRGWQDFYFPRSTRVGCTQKFSGTVQCQEVRTNVEVCRHRHQVATQNFLFFSPPQVCFSAFPVSINGSTILHPPQASVSDLFFISQLKRAAFFFHNTAWLHVKAIAKITGNKKVGFISLRAKRNFTNMNPSLHLRRLEMFVSWRCKDGEGKVLPLQIY